MASPNILTFSQACASRAQALAAEQTASAMAPLAHTVSRLAELADLPEATVRQAIQSGEVPSFLIRQRRLVLHDDAVAWLMRRRIQYERSPHKPEMHKRSRGKK